MSISIVLRSSRTSELKGLVSYLKQNRETEKEVIAVCVTNDYELEGVDVILEDSNRFKARITGIKRAQFDRVLLLDSDQIPEDGLLTELNNKIEDMVIILERSLSKGLTEKCLDDWRRRNEEIVRRKPSPYVPVVPRLYLRSHLLRAIDELSDSVLKIVSHEDSVLYYYVYKISQNIGLTTRHILNRDPNIFRLMQKAYMYGKNSRSVQVLDIPPDIRTLLDKLNYSTLNIKGLGMGVGYLVQIPRGFAYKLGEMI